MSEDDLAPVTGAPPRPPARDHRTAGAPDETSGDDRAAATAATAGTEETAATAATAGTDETAATAATDELDRIEADLAAVDALVERFGESTSSDRAAVLDSLEQPLGGARAAAHPGTQA